MARNPKNWQFCTVRKCGWKRGYEVDYIGSDGKRHVRYAGKTLREGLRFQDELARTGQLAATPGAGITLAQFAKIYLAERANSRVKASTLREDVRRLSNTILPLLGHLSLAEFDYGVIESYKQERLNAVGKATFNRERSLLSSLFTCALKHGLVGKHPIRGLVPALRERPPERRVFSEPEQAVFLEACQAVDARAAHPYLYDMCLLSFDTAARPGRQVLGLRWRDIDFDANIIRFADTKSNKPHTVSMTERLAAALRRRHACRQSEEYLFPGKNGNKPLVKYQRRFAEALKVAGLPASIPPYSMRHTALTNLAMRKMAVQDIRDVAGHASIVTTQRYLRASRAAQKVAAAILGGIGEAKKPAVAESVAESGSQEVAQGGG